MSCSRPNQVNMRMGIWDCMDWSTISTYNESKIHLGIDSRLLQLTNTHIYAFLEAFFFLPLPWVDGCLMIGGFYQHHFHISLSGVQFFLALMGQEFLWFWSMVIDLDDGQAQPVGSVAHAHQCWRVLFCHKRKINFVFL